MFKRSMILGAIAALAAPVLVMAGSNTIEGAPYASQTVSFQAGQGGSYYLPVPTVTASPNALTGRDNNTRPVRLVQKQMGQGQMVWIAQAD